MPSCPTPTNLVGVNANRRDPHKPGESPPLNEGVPFDGAQGKQGKPASANKRGEIPEKSQAEENG